MKTYFTKLVQHNNAFLAGYLYLSQKSLDEENQDI